MAPPASVAAECWREQSVVDNKTPPASRKTSLRSCSCHSSACSSTRNPRQSVHSGPAAQTAALWEEHVRLGEVNVELREHAVATRRELSEARHAHEKVARETELVRRSCAEEQARVEECRREGRLWCEKLVRCRDATTVSIACLEKFQAESVDVAPLSPSETRSAVAATRESVAAVCEGIAAGHTDAADICRTKNLLN
eukprot:NODE_15873_length_1025_cov_1.062361.p2 GENE.NODE_15873_length_1025_cov_1.062361~~NODE_15873_length_1025_cov_1.062361.p2  ORF type:complete len:198 (+),score=43.08 NODE_15873_length_1025_cov_1.062361:185-778(+)